MQRQRLQDEAETLRKQCRDTLAQKEAQAAEMKAELDKKSARIEQTGVELAGRRTRYVRKRRRRLR